jgi:hypothetical protein
MGSSWRKNRPRATAGWAVGGLFAFYAGTGTSGFVTMIGERLASPADAGRPWRATVRGGIALELTYLVPIIGWFGVLPASIILGAGAMTLSFFKWDKASGAVSFETRGLESQAVTEMEPAEVLS